MADTDSLLLAAPFSSRNGLVNPAVQYEQYLPFIAVQDVLPAASLAVMAAGLPACERAISTCAQNTTTGLIGCLTAMGTCNLAELMPFQLSGLNPYDVREKCEVPPLCYNFTNGKRQRTTTSRGRGIPSIVSSRCLLLCSLRCVRPLFL